MSAEVESERIDKWLWTVRLFKTRSLALQAIKGGKVKLDGVNVKPSRTVKIGEVYTVQTSNLRRQVKVLDIPSSRLGAKLLADFVEDMSPAEQLPLEEQFKRKQFIIRDPGTGRPTKKDRRELDDLIDW